ncbi:MAG: hypothetical protein VKN13_00865 [Cyanobacteriota bacterium]|nr:hypothetical protein [Cyanobacteriota bacterium]
MSYLLQFCGLSDPLQLFYLEQRSQAAEASGPAFAGFRPCQLDDLLSWATATAQGRGWDRGAIERTVIDGWLDRAEVIRQWQLRLRQEPGDRLLVAGLGTQHDWGRRYEQLFRA